jgi:hypothetical protein
MNTDTTDPDELRSQTRPEYQAGLAARYQASLARAGGVRAAVDRDGADALSDLLTDLTPLLLTIAVERVQARYGKPTPAGLVEDCLVEAQLAVVNAAADFDPGRGVPFHSWVAATKGVVRKVIRSALEAYAGIDHLPEGSRTVLRWAHVATAKLHESLGRAPSGDEVCDEVRTYAYSRGAATLTVTEQQLPAAEQTALVRDRVRKRGWLAAINDLPELLAFAEATESPDAHPDGWSLLEPTGSVNADPVAFAGAGADPDTADLLELAFAGLNEEDRALLEARFGAGDTDPQGVDTVAASFGVPVSRVKAAAGAASARMQAAHAHFAYLAAGVAAQFDAPPAAEPAVGSLLGAARAHS